MVPPKEYFYYLKTAFKKNHVHGYMIGHKANRKICIYAEGDKWIVSEVWRGVAVSPTEYNLDNIWHACEDIIARLARDEKHRKKIWMDWASPSNWAEKMDEPVSMRVISSEEAMQIIKRRNNDQKVCSKDRKLRCITD